MRRKICSHPQGLLAVVQGFFPCKKGHENKVTVGTEPMTKTGTEVTTLNY